MLANTASREISQPELPGTFPSELPASFFVLAGFPCNPASFLHALGVGGFVVGVCDTCTHHEFHTIEFFYISDALMHKRDTQQIIHGHVYKFIVRNELLIMCRHLCFELYISSLLLDSTVSYIYSSKLLHTTALMMR